MRKTITWEGLQKVKGVIIEKDGFKWGDEPIPVVHSEMLLGHARDLHREEDGRITAEIDFLDETDNQKHAKTILEHGDMTTSVYANEVVEKKEGNLRHVFSATIREVNLVFPYQVGWS